MNTWHIGVWTFPDFLESRLTHVPSLVIEMQLKMRLKNKQCVVKFILFI